MCIAIEIGEDLSKPDEDGVTSELHTTNTAPAAESDAAFNGVRVVARLRDLAATSTGKCEEIWQATWTRLGVASSPKIASRRALYRQARNFAAIEVILVNYL